MTVHGECCEMECIERGSAHCAAPAPIPAPAPRPGVIRRAAIACHPAFAETAAAASADSPPIRVATARRERVVLGD